MKHTSNTQPFVSAFVVFALLGIGLSGCKEERRSDTSAAPVQPPSPVVVHSATFEAQAMSKKEIAALGIKTESAYGGGAVVSRFETVLEFVAPGNTREVLQVGDVITTFGESPVNTAVDLQQLLANMAPGTSVRAIVRRGDAYLELAIRTGRAHAKDDTPAGSLSHA